ncbi:MAG: two-component system response regulator [Methylococcaceae bacterium]|nr:two-component system response regulator [Methylococcaceae bacterium]MDP2392002.1 two-component system response regulator [Methylococcaceae bacterium]MDP3020905.1 two-component system response regulator [Methylococcaceae bacterium]MDP3391119.1 two-component system response regulator [Methylococcaceae bacterium]MDP3932906.1 two-component system response regulator [Methylococcaceae bacterium]
MQTILIVDDAPENLSLLSDLLQPYYQVRAANSGLRALRTATTDPQPDLILLDVIMPSMDGYEVITQLKADPHTANIPVIFVTAMESSEDEEHGLALGAMDYITKPIKPAIVLARIKTHLELKAASDWLHDRNKVLEAEIAQRMEDNLIIQDVTIRALAHLAETRDPETGNHLLRTQSYIQILALQLQNHPRFQHFLTATNIQNMVKSAPLHDIGKVGIPDNILLKPGKLTADEWEVMKTHSYLGFRAIELAEQDAERPLEFLNIAKDISRYHHEKWDGTGYPDGLQGDAIPISARLMALADIFDALVSERAYKTAFPIEKVIETISQGRERFFDPDIVDAFLQRQNDFIAIARRHADSREAVLAKRVLLKGQGNQLL